MPSWFICAPSMWMRARLPPTASWLRNVWSSDTTRDSEPPDTSSWDTRIVIVWNQSSGNAAMALSANASVGVVASVGWTSTQVVPDAT